MCTTLTVRGWSIYGLFGTHQTQNKITTQNQIINPPNPHHNYQSNTTPTNDKPTSQSPIKPSHNSTKTQPQLLWNPFTQTHISSLATDEGRPPTCVDHHGNKKRATETSNLEPPCERRKMIEKWERRGWEWSVGERGERRKKIE